MPAPAPSARTVRAAVAPLAVRGPEWEAWAEEAPARLGSFLERWELAPDGEAVGRPAGVALPVRDREGGAAWLTAAPAEAETAAAHLALRHWDGRGAVRLLRADPRARVLLVERTRAEDLTGRWDLEACEVVAGLYRRLHVAAPPSVPRLGEVVAARSEELARLPRSAPVPRRLVEQALSLAPQLAAGDDPPRLLHGDLGYQTVLAADREPWLAVEPRPLAGDPHYEPVPLLWGRWAEVRDGGGVRDAVRRRFHTVVDAASLEEDRARDWVVVRAVHEALAALRSGRSPARQRDRVTVCVTVAKAVQE